MPSRYERPSGASYLPPWLQHFVDSISTSPATTGIESAGYAEPMVEALGKPVSELLGRVFQTKEKVAGVPRRLMFSGWDSRRGVMQFHPTPARSPIGVTTSTPNIGAAPFEVTPEQLSHLINSEVLGYEPGAMTQKAAGIRQKIESMLEASGFMEKQRRAEKAVR